MWKLLNKLFDYDYIAWRNSADKGVARLHREEGNGRCWYWRYKNTCCADVIKDSDQVIWLTCEPSKYLDT